MAPVRRTAARGSASLRPSYALAPSPPPAPAPASASDVGHLSPRTLVKLEQLFLATLPKGYLRDVPPQQRTALMTECSDLDPPLLRKWWLLRQWQERKKLRVSPLQEGDEAEQDDSQASVTSRQGLTLQLSPPKQPPTEGLSEHEHSGLYQPAPPHSPAVSRAGLAESPTADSFHSSNSPPRLPRSRLTFRMYTQTQHIPAQTPPQQPRFGGGGHEEDPFASPRPKVQSGGKSLLGLGEGIQHPIQSSTIGRLERTEESPTPLWADLTRSMEKIISGEQAGSGVGAEEQQAFDVNDIYHMSRLGVNENEDPILFFCCQRLAIGNWVRVLDLRNPELMFYFSPLSSCFQAWTAYNSRFYRISLPISAIASIKIYHDVDNDEACLLITRSIFARPTISFSTSKPMTLKWDTTPHDFTVQNQATRCDTWCVALKSAGAAISVIRRIAGSEYEKAGGQEEAGLSFLRKVWWGPWDSETTTINDLVSSLDLPLTVEPADPLETVALSDGEEAPTTLEFQHPRLPQDRIWCSRFLHPSQKQGLNSQSPPPVAPHFGARADQLEQELRCPWLTDDLDRRLLNPWPNPTFPPPAVVEDEWSTLAKSYSPSPEKNQPAYRPSLQLNTSQTAKKTILFSSPSHVSFSAAETSSIPGILTDDFFASPVERKATIDWSDEEATGQEYPLDWLLEGYTHFA